MAKWAFAAAMLRFSVVKGANYKMAVFNDWPPYAFGNVTNPLQGLVPDVVRGMDKLETGTCAGKTFELVLKPWSECWTNNTIGEGLKNGDFQACMAYTHTKGIRNNFCDFGHPIIDNNSPAGLLTLLDENCKPKVTGLDDLNGKTVVDVGGWAPGEDGFKIVKNFCTDAVYSSNAILITPAEDGPDAAMQYLRAGKADAMLTYADQAHIHQSGCKNNDDVSWNCSLWEGFGTEYAYVQTGQIDYLENGTTLVMAKKDEGIVEKLNPCMLEFMQTKEYYDICVTHETVDICFRNSHFPVKDHPPRPWSKPTNDQTGECWSGYCKCPATTNLFAIVQDLETIPDKCKIRVPDSFGHQAYMSSAVIATLALLGA